MKTSDIEQDISNRIEELLTSLTVTRTTFQAWAANQNPTLATEHHAWQISKRKAFLRDAAAVAEFDSRDPYLQSMPEVKKLKTKIQRIESELNAARSELVGLYELGTPRDEFRNLVEQGQNAVVSITQNLKQLRIEQVLQDLYSTSNVQRLPESCVEAGKLQPSVVAIDMLHFSPLLTNGHDSDLALDNAYNRIVDGLGKLRNLIVGDVPHGPP
jgi:DNA repair exonuclease SbcCD ATPase subunit